MSDKCPLSVRRSYCDGKVGVRMELSVLGSYGRGLSKSLLSADISVEDARAIAAALLAEATLVEGKEQKKALHEERRRKWRDREIAAGRMVVIGTEKDL